VALDRTGQVTGAATAFPLSHVAGITPGAGALVVTGARAQDDRPVALGIDAQGHVRWEAEVPVAGTLELWPVPAPLDGEAVSLIWATSGRPAAVSVARLERGRCQPATEIPCDDTTVALEVAAARGRLMLARTHDSPAGLEVLRLVEGAPVQRAAVAQATRPFSPSVVAAGEEWALLWLSRGDGAVQVAPLDDDLHLGEPMSIAAGATPPWRPRTARLIQGGGPCQAVTWQTTAPGDDVLVGRETQWPAPRQHTEQIEQFVGAYDPQTQRMGAIQPLAEAGIVCDAGAWVGDALLMLHGVSSPAISIYGR
jgi:hypothetical protein